jgi:hypothetical protein
MAAPLYVTQSGRLWHAGLILLVTGKLQSKTKRPLVHARLFSYELVNSWSSWYVLGRNLTRDRDLSDLAHTERQLEARPMSPVPSNVTSDGSGSRPAATL